MPELIDWEIEGAEGQLILGTAYQPDEAARGCAIIAHGFKGYKDFRMIPAIARELCAAGLVAHTFNFSHSGMTRNVETFERPDLFERDTWNKQVYDFRSIVSAIAEGRLAGRQLPYVLVGHSRGGVAALLFAGRHAGDASLEQPAGIVTAGSPDYACGMSDDQKAAMRAAGWLESPSARTGQTLRVGRSWLEEQEADPAGHDLLANVAKLRCPLLVVHGEEDETVAVESAESIAAAARNARVVRIEGANHVFNAPNPAPLDVTQVPALSRMTQEVAGFATKCCERAKAGE